MPSVKKWVQSGSDTLRRSLSTANPNAASGSGVVIAPDQRPGGRYVSKMQGLNKQWPHPPEILLTASIEYQVRFLGKTEVAEQSGAEVMRQALHKIQFHLSNRKADLGTAASKLPKVIISLSMEGIKITEKSTGEIMDKYPLHRISFVAEDKQDARVFSFIAKRATTDQHDCFVFMSEKLANEITLTIGEAFDLAYKQFKQSGGGGGSKALEQERRIKVMQRQLVDLEEENSKLRRLLMSHSILSTGPPLSPAPDRPSNMPTTPNASRIDALPTTPKWEHFTTSPNLNGSRPSLPLTPVPQSPPSSQLAGPPVAATRRSKPSVASPKQKLSLDSSHVFDDSFDPRADERAAKMKEKLAESGTKDTFGHDPFNDEFFTEDGATPVPSTVVPMEERSTPMSTPTLLATQMTTSTQQQLDDDIAALDEEMNAIRMGFANNPLVSLDMTTSSIDMGGAALIDSLRLSNADQSTVTTPEEVPTGN